MCRNIHTLHNFDPPATPDEIRAAALQYVRKVSGYTKPPAANRAAFERALEAVTRETTRLLSQLVSSAPSRTREAEAAKARERWIRREARMRAEVPHTHHGASHPRGKAPDTRGEAEHARAPRSRTKAPDARSETPRARTTRGGGAPSRRRSAGAASPARSRS